MIDLAALLLQEHFSPPQLYLPPRTLKSLALGRCFQTRDKPPWRRRVRTKLRSGIISNLATRLFASHAKLNWLSRSVLASILNAPGTHHTSRKLQLANIGTETDQSRIEITHSRSLDVAPSMMLEPASRSPRYRAEVSISVISF